MNKIKLTFVANKNIDNEMLHCLYTSVRFLNKKECINDEFKINNDGRVISIIIDENKIENNNSEFVFFDKNKKEIKIKLLKKEVFKINNELNNGDKVSVFGLISHERKHFLGNNGEKLKNGISYCVLDTFSRFKKGTKKDFLNYLTRETGLDFISAESDNKVIFERIVFDENEIFNGKLNRKVAIKNVIVINSEFIEVVDKIKANALFYKNIGKRKSYGMGSLNIDKLDVV